MIGIAKGPIWGSHDAGITLSSNGEYVDRVSKNAGITNFTQAHLFSSEGITSAYQYDAQEHTFTLTSTDQLRMLNTCWKRHQYLPQPCTIESSYMTGGCPHILRLIRPPAPHHNSMLQVLPRGRRRPLRRSRMIQNLHPPQGQSQMFHFRNPEAQQMQEPQTTRLLSQRTSRKVRISHQTSKLR